MAKPTLVDDGALCRCGSRTIEGDCFGCGKPPRTCDCPRGALEAAPMRRCIGSTKFGIEAHQAPPADFPVQPSQKDGLGRMCKTHWNQYTTALRKAALARKTAAGQATVGEATAEATTEATPPQPEPAAAAVKGKRVARRRRQAETVAEVAQEPPAG
jgi:hypothetical protein